jgi:LysR family transcriptional activator of nhaA
VSPRETPPDPRYAPPDDVQRNTSCNRHERREDGVKAFGQVGAGIFAVPTAIEKEVCRQYHVKVCGRADSIRERFYLISAERKLKHPAVAAVAQLARQKLFA